MGREFSVDEGFDGNSFGEFDKSATTRQEAALFNTQEAEVAGILKNQLGVEVTDRSARIIADLGGDSLDIVEIVMALEEHFEIEISDDEAETINTVDDAFKVVKTATDHEADASIRPVKKG